MEKEVSRAIRSRLESAYGDRLRGIVLYGSESRGDAGPDSDIDLLVLLQGPIHLWQDLRTCVHALYPLTLALGRPLTPKPVDVLRYGSDQVTLFQNARRQEIPL
ncbi:MAG: hypothetical protein AUJ92_07595 [Armatimonadetes bacterium CG2_30_59_28]|nr:nucleotidyltransferase domain-containing protein [Armatimonadota bacterium]OIO95622.1 MAG: hypothetical protein AUJ92_07595 [Armatimonadetes bacterium CG2_30_59_28]PIU65888.1 MAG: hypothetical protein COS85_07070 [Armatimonadetes bacterium CG07_land_8_20_14_0_80_59_28]